MKIIEDSKGERGLGPFHCGRKQLQLSKLNSFWYILAATIFNTNVMDSICMNDHGVTPRSREAVLALLSTMSEINHSAN